MKSSRCSQTGSQRPSSPSTRDDACSHTLDARSQVFHVDACRLGQRPRPQRRDGRPVYIRPGGRPQVAAERCIAARQDRICSVLPAADFVQRIRIWICDSLPLPFPFFLSGSRWSCRDTPGHRLTFGPLGGTGLPCYDTWVISEMGVTLCWSTL